MFPEARDLDFMLEIYLALKEDSQILCFALYEIKRDYCSGLMSCFFSDTTPTYAVLGLFSL